MSREHRLIRHKPTRGFFEAKAPLIDEKGYQLQQGTYIRKGFHLVPCDGEAHQPGGGYIDNCMSCAPLWGEVAVPDICKTMSDWRNLYHSLQMFFQWLCEK